MDMRNGPGTAREILRWLIVALALLSGCSRDRQVLKKKHFDRGHAYFEKGRYQEAAIEYANAIRIDPQYAEARFNLAECFLRQGQWRYAYPELARAVELDPGNTRAQLDLSGLLLAAGKSSEARDHAEAVLKAEPRNVGAQEILSNALAKDHLARQLRRRRKPSIWTPIAPVRI